MHLPYLPSSSPNQTVDRSLQQRENIIKMLQFQLHKAQHRMKQYAGNNRSEREFTVGQWAYLKPQSYQQTSVQQRENDKPSQGYYGPFQIIDKVGKVSYKLHLPPSSQIHQLFHVSQLKHCWDPSKMDQALPALFHDSTLPGCPKL